MKHLIFGLILLLSLLNCKKNPDSQIEKLIQNPGIKDEVVIIEVTKQILKSQFKEIRVEKTDEKFNVLIDFGGSTALTFQEKKVYEKEMKLLTAKYMIELFYYLSSRKTDKLTLSLVKPFYIHEPQINKDVIQEFEVFRTSLDLATLDTIEGWRDWDTKAWNHKGEDQDRLVEQLNKVISIWKVELNEFGRIELE
ncbi:MAG: hypothetical protein H7A24_09275 [Leptospiraceae bacterium]|nr:hypothetical protein [Leptospiraceae bacterium]MCP5512061.1 hypothetical protein [Leptospiraceae bacterium]